MPGNQPAPSPVEPLVIFDGFCNLCSFSVRLLHRLDRKGVFHFMFRQQVEDKQISEGESIPESVFLLEGGILYQKSEAFIRILGLLPFPWPIFTILRYIPGRIRDPLYDWIARNRYRWFGKKTTCMLPSPELRERFTSVSLPPARFSTPQIPIAPDIHPGID